MNDRAIQGNGKETALPTRMFSAMRSFIVGWMTAGVPPPVAAPPTVGVRAFDYATGYNTDYTPRQGETFSFSQLRSLADNYDLLRLVIETRKDQVKRQHRRFRVKKDATKTNKEYAKQNAEDPRLKVLDKFFKSPDKEHTFNEWIGLLLEEVLVIDAPVVYPRFTLGGELFALEVIDGGTVRRILSNEGRTPIPPDPAYQQILKGVPAVNVTAVNPTEKLYPQFIYKPRNPRAGKVYGYPPVEQIAMTVNIALRRQLHQLQYYTEGNVPDVIIGTPETWTAEMIKGAEQYWNSMFLGNTGQRRKAKFVAGDAKNIQFTKEQTLKDEMDEWLAKIVAFAFSISPQALVKQMNKASAQESVDASLSEGLQPILEYFKELIDFIIETYFGWDDIEFSFEDDNTEDPKDLADVHDKYVRNGVMSVDEVREVLGFDAVGMPNAIYTMTGATLLEDAKTTSANAAKNSAQPSPEASGGSTNGKQPKSQTPPDDKNKSDMENRKSKSLRISSGTMTHKMSEDIPVMRKFLAAFFKKEAKRIAKQMKASYAREVKAQTKDDSSPPDKVMKDLNLDTWDKLRDEISRLLEDVFRDGTKNAFVDLHVFDNQAVFDIVNQIAVDYANTRAAELVGKRITSTGEVIENPNARWAITTTTRNKIRDIIVEAFTDGMTPAEVSDAIIESVAFSESRADMIARTELAKANVEATVTSWRESGLVIKKKWLLSDDHDEDDVCDDNAEEGEIDIEKTFDSGDDAPPAHPRCNCDVAAETVKAEDGTALTEEQA